MAKKTTGAKKIANIRVGENICLLFICFNVIGLFDVIIYHDVPVEIAISDECILGKIPFVLFDDRVVELIFISINKHNVGECFNYCNHISCKMHHWRACIIYGMGGWRSLPASTEN